VADSTLLELSKFPQQGGGLNGQPGLQEHQLGIARSSEGLMGQTETHWLAPSRTSSPALEGFAKRDWPRRGLENCGPLGPTRSWAGQCRQGNSLRFSSPSPGQGAADGVSARRRH